MQFVARTSSPPCLSARDLWFAYPESEPVLRGVSFTLDDSGFVALVGQNGSGKTTLVKHFNGLLRPMRGEVLLYGEDIRDRAVSQLACAVGYVFQNPDHQIFSATVREEISFGLQQMALAPGEIAVRTDEALAAFHLEPFADEPPATLSFGLRRKVTVAAIFAMRPRVWILDEPTTGLDRAAARALMERVLSLQREGATILLITHDMRLVAEYAPRTAVMRGGEIIAADETRAVFAQPELLREAGLELPPITELARRLSLPGTPLTVDEFTEIHRTRMNAD